MEADSFYGRAAADDDGDGDDTDPRPRAPPPPVRLIPVAPPPEPPRGAGLATIFQRCRAQAAERRAGRAGGASVDLTREEVDLTRPVVRPTPPVRQLAPIFQRGAAAAAPVAKGKRGKAKEEARECVVRNARTGQHEYVDRDGKRTPCD